MCLGDKILLENIPHPGYRRVDQGCTASLIYSVHVETTVSRSRIYSMYCLDLYILNLLTNNCQQIKDVLPPCTCRNNCQFWQGKVQFRPLIDCISCRGSIQYSQNSFPSQMCLLTDTQSGVKQQLTTDICNSVCLKCTFTYMQLYSVLTLKQVTCVCSHALTTLECTQHVLKYFAPRIHVFHASYVLFVCTVDTEVCMYAQYEAVLVCIIFMQVWGTVEY